MSRNAIDSGTQLLISTVRSNLACHSLSERIKVSEGVQLSEKANMTGDTPILKSPGKVMPALDRLRETQSREPSWFLSRQIANTSST